VALKYQVIFGQSTVYRKTVFACS